jgi:hypothetical protein
MKMTTKGLHFACLVVANALGDNEKQIAAISRERFGSTALPTRIAEAGGLIALGHMKAEIAAGGTVAANWAELLVDADAAAAEFFELVRERTLFGRIPGFRRMPLRTRAITVSSGFTAAWTGEGRAVPMSSAVFAETTLPALKVSSLTVQTRELLQGADSGAEALVRDDMVGALATAINASFIDPNNSGIANVEPASVTESAPSVAATGDGLADLRALIDAFPGDLETAVLVGSGESFAALHDPLGLPRLGVRGGEALGIPAYATTAAGSTVALIDPAGIAWGANETSVRTTREASIEMLDSNLTGDSINVVPPTAASTVSMWQSNSVAIIADQAIAWEPARPSAAILEGVGVS